MGRNLFPNKMVHCGVLLDTVFKFNNEHFSQPEKLTYFTMLTLEIAVHSDRKYHPSSGITQNLILEVINTNYSIIRSTTIHENILLLPVYGV